MSEFNIAIYELAQTAMAELEQGKQSGKVPSNPRSEAHFFSAWVTRALKQQRFPHCVVKTLQAWQKQARTKGVNAGIGIELGNIISAYQPMITDGAMAPVTQQQLEALFDQLDDQDWHLERDYPVDRKVSQFTDGKASLVVCCNKWQQVFDVDGTLKKRLSLYARGDLSQLVDCAYEQGLLLHKVTDYKSVVKYHAELLVYPLNAAPVIAEFPSKG